MILLEIILQWAKRRECTATWTNCLMLILKDKTNYGTRYIEQELKALLLSISNWTLTSLP